MRLRCGKAVVALPGNGIPRAVVQLHCDMAVLRLRLLGLLLLTLAIAIPSCQALFPRAASIEAPAREWTDGR